MKTATMVGLCCLVFPCISLACPYFMYPTKHKRPAYFTSQNCDFEWLNADTDGDGVADWQLVPGYGNILLPLDPDIDGDGVPNFFDPEPFFANPTGFSFRHQVPAHTLTGFKHQDSEAAQLQQQIYKRYGILTANLSSTLSVRTLRTLIKVFEAFHIRPEHPLATRLKHIFASGEISRRGAHGYYIEPIATIMLPGEDHEISQWNDIQLIELIAHEIGHAAVFTFFSPHEFVRFGRKYGGWQALNHEDSFYSLDLRTKMFRGPKMDNAMPSQYAKLNLHEWFAEVFAAFVKSRMFKQEFLPSRISKALNKLVVGP